MAHFHGDFSVTSYVQVVNYVEIDVLSTMTLRFDICQFDRCQNLVLKRHLQMTAVKKEYIRNMYKTRGARVVLPLTPVLPISKSLLKTIAVYSGD